MFPNATFFCSHQYGMCITYFAKYFDGIKLVKPLTKVCHSTTFLMITLFSVYRLSSRFPRSIQDLQTWCATGRMHAQRAYLACAGRRPCTDSGATALAVRPRDEHVVHKAGAQVAIPCVLDEDVRRSATAVVVVLRVGVAPREQPPVEGRHCEGQDVVSEFLTRANHTQVAFMHAGACAVSTIIRAANNRGG